MTTGGTGVILGSVRKIATAYDGQGNAYLFTSLNSSNGIVNQVKRDFNGLGQLVAEWQATTGYVYGSTPKVQYTYSEMAGGANHSRLTGMIYPSGYELDYNYTSGLDSDISRLSSLSDSTGTLEAYAYLGLSTVVVRSRPQPDVDLTYVQQGLEPNGDAGDQYAGLDRFGRIEDQRWIDAGSGIDVDRYEYGYDRGGNRVYRDNLVNSALGEVYTYDNLDQLTTYDRGTLNGSKDGITGSVSRAMDWDYDALGNWSGVDVDGVTETRTHNAQNEITAISGATSPQYLANSSMSRDEQGRLYSYNAWNQLIMVRAAIGGTILVEYSYDALGHRKTVSAGGVTTTLYNSSNWQTLEERVGSNTTERYVNSPGYVDDLVLRDRDTDNNGSLDERLWVQQDANHNVTSIVDNSGVVVEGYGYEPFGAQSVYSPTFAVLSGSAYAFTVGFQGFHHDDVTGNVYVRNREYSVTLGRPIQTDPLDLQPDVNWYRWEGNNPVRYVDPQGTDFLDWAGRALAGTVSGAAAGAGTGAVAGGVIGSVVPGPGTLAGAGAGAAGGAIAGGISGFIGSFFTDSASEAAKQGAIDGAIAGPLGGGVNAVRQGRQVLNAALAAEQQAAANAAKIARLQNRANKCRDILSQKGLPQSQRDIANAQLYKIADEIKNLGGSLTP